MHLDVTLADDENDGRITFHADGLVVDEDSVVVEDADSGEEYEVGGWSGKQGCQIRNVKKDASNCSTVQ